MIKNYSLFLFAAILFTCCTSDDNNGCSSADWIGTYTLDESTEVCASPETVSLNETVVISAGSSSGNLNFEGIEVEIDGCSINESTFIFTATLNGTTLDVSGFGCTGTYNKN